MFPFHCHRKHQKAKYLLVHWVIRNWVHWPEIGLRCFWLSDFKTFVFYNWAFIILDNTFKLCCKIKRFEKNFFCIKQTFGIFTVSILFSKQKKKVHYYHYFSLFDEMTVKLKQRKQKGLIPITASTIICTLNASTAQTLLQLFLHMLLVFSNRYGVTQQVFLNSLTNIIWTWFL